MVVGHNVPSDSVIVRLNDGGRRCACSKASRLRAAEGVRRNLRIVVRRLLLALALLATACSAPAAPSGVVVVLLFGRRSDAVVDAVP